ncbi:hypothetical protein [Streptomyces sp. SBT349]|uniref:hypothetical protein n=1 Tax=Streptomyces sp. SBT349 TaxID=1580539 RepID=UPI00066E2674|nr:hypothetical protein [Streptomyces sp. SBT349]
MVSSAGLGAGSSLGSSRQGRGHHAARAHDAAARSRRAGLSPRPRAISVEVVESLPRGAPAPGGLALVARDALQALDHLSALSRLGLSTLGMLYLNAAIAASGQERSAATTSTAETMRRGPRPAAEQQHLLKKPKRARIQLGSGTELLCTGWRLWVRPEDEEQRSAPPDPSPVRGEAPPGRGRRSGGAGGRVAQKVTSLQKK